MSQTWVGAMIIYSVLVTWVVIWKIKAHAQSQITWTGWERVSNDREGSFYWFNGTLEGIDSRKFNYKMDRFGDGGRGDCTCHK